MNGRMQLDLDLNEFNLLSDNEANLLTRVNQTDKPYRSNVTIAELFVEQAEKTPDRVAVVEVDRERTYAELHAEANQLARILKDAGVVPSQLVGILADRSSRMVSAVLAILQAGGGYVPVDPHYPRARIRYLLQDSRCKVLVTESMYLDEIIPDLPDSIETIICLDETSFHYEGYKVYTASDIRGQKDEAIAPAGSEDDVAYVIYTSGSTGAPKGVMISHKQVLNTLFWLEETFPLSETDVVAQKTSISFTDSVWELFWPLMVGSKLSILKEEDGKDPGALYDWLREQRITVTQFVPAMMNVFLAHVHSRNEPDPLPNLKWVFNGGEALTANLVREWNRLFRIARIANIYGMTESAIYASVYLCTEQPAEESLRIPVGVPIANTHMFILGQTGEICPPEVKGEICIGGIGITDGYLGKPELTEKAFTYHPNTGERLYRTGDVGLLSETGVFEYLGRMDDQVQVRGYRVELKEVERAVLQHSAVNQVAVLAITDQMGLTELACYYVVQKDGIQPDGLRAHLLEWLPGYMIPSYFMELSEMPLTPHGKIDRKALPAVKPGVSSDYVAPANPIEQKLAELWADVLQISSPGVLDHFVGQGGHSLKAIQLLSRIESDFQVKLSMRDLFDAPTIRGLATRLTGHLKETEQKPIALLSDQEYYPVTGAQERLYLLWQLEEDATSYHTPGVMRIIGSLDSGRLQDIADQLVARHEALRTSFHLMEGQVKQKVHGDLSVQIETWKADEETVEKEIERFFRPFDLKQAPLLRIGLIALSSEEHLLIFDMHHIISDGISKSILLEEFCNLYQGQVLPELSVQAKEFAWWQREQAAEIGWAEHEAYWLDAFSQQPQPLAIPTDYPRPQTMTFDGDELLTELSGEWLEKLDSFTRQSSSTLYMLLLAVYSVLLSKYSNQEDIVIGCDMDGRQRAEFAPVVGMFVNTLALRNWPKKELTVREYIGQVRQNVLSGFEHGDYPFDQLVSQIQFPRDPARNPLFDAMLTLHHAAEQQKVRLDQIEFAPYEFRRKAAMLDLALEVVKAEDHICMHWQYNTNLYHRRTIEKMAQDFVNLLEQMVAHPNRTIGQLQIGHGVVQVAQGQVDDDDFAF
ncbi:edeine non-ribosomal peptide synthetase EdeL [Brevibacillus sp. MS2.2]|uniref:edeine non-ribosomal peptide synthetase EdeL n=1 Tax=Brevibacillus sp. MS2.2 TaxID=2738981 RepID=UPI00156BACB2|nr:edeine non-ribosomal peptide synthetase EdeL [Brevibacillus sp. MS2.2]NRR20015.1 edeine non-ribosomal peptide synthetase EdeL [Brevibacillus sp. MS2.2]